MGVKVPGRIFGGYARYIVAYLEQAIGIDEKELALLKSKFLEAKQ